MITAYHRPESIDEALELISRPSPRTVPLGGGTVLSHYRGEGIEVVDLQALGLNQIVQRGKTLEIGATVTLQELLENPACTPAMAGALKLEAPLNLRNSSSLGGTLMVCDGRSTLVMVLLALDGRVAVMHPETEVMALGEFLPLRDKFQNHALITRVEIPIGPEVQFDYVARTPADKPIVAVAVARWPSGRTRLAVGGYGPMPLLAMDGTEDKGMDVAARNAMHGATDPWGSAEYRMDVAATLARRCLSRL